jgi:hypothetical protein
VSSAALEQRIAGSIACYRHSALGCHSPEAFEAAAHVDHATPYPPLAKRRALQELSVQVRAEGWAW